MFSETGRENSLAVMMGAEPRNGMERGKWTARLCTVENRDIHAAPQFSYGGLLYPRDPYKRKLSRALSCPLPIVFHGFIFASPPGQSWLIQQRPFQTHVCLPVCL